jgi:endonuclease YncB( thermonuclease family)
VIRAVGVLLLVAACGPAGATHEDTMFSAHARALDGDTIAADFRLLGVDAFERRQLCEKNSSCWECGKVAQDVAAHMLSGAEAEIRLSARSSYSRPVATVRVNGRDPGQALLRAGLAVPQPQYLAADPARAARYAKATEEAQRRKAGAFAGKWIAPADWRAGERLSCER